MMLSLSLRHRTNGSSGGPSESHGWLPPSASTSSFRGSPSNFSSSKNSLRDRLKDLRGNITGSISGFKKNRPSYSPDTLYRVKTRDNILSMALADAQQIEKANQQTWPAIRKSISSMASSLQSNRTSVDSSRSAGEALCQSSSRHSKTSFRGSREGARRVVTMCTCPPPIALNRTGSQARHSSFSTLSAVVSRPESIPQLPGLDEPSNFRESFNDTGLLRTSTTSSEATNTADAIKVQSATVVDSEAFIERARPIIGRLPFRLRNADVLNNKACERADGPQQSSSSNVSSHSTLDVIINSVNIDYKQAQQQHTSTLEKPPRPIDSSRHPVEFLDRVLETSFATRNPISPKLCVSHAIMQALHKNKNSILVELPEDNDQPEPLRCYPGLKAALEDICDRFGMYYAQFAAYNGRERKITLYKTGTERPVNRILDLETATAIFDLHQARSAWVRPNVINDKDNDTWSTDVNMGEVSDTDVPMDDASPATSNMAEASGYSRSGTDETLMTDVEYEDTQNTKFWADGYDGDDEDDVVDVDMAVRLGLMTTHD
ncbi:hypothetical protein HD806DRAFT_542851 [Xylariaceae sp. AK1471]|nr:hypothetical protein HD806DRAFT_542851 [Xylariaceae sp. AK1471]